MSDPNDAPAAAWYPDPQTPGRVRWWDGTAWTEHVSVPAPAVPVMQAIAPATPQLAVPQIAVAPAAAAQADVPQVAEADAALAAADADHAGASPDGYIGRHAAGATPAPRQPGTAPRSRPRIRVEETPEHLSYAS